MGRRMLLICIGLAAVALACGVGYSVYIVDRGMQGVRARAQCTAVAKSIMQAIADQEDPKSITSGYPIAPMMRGLPFDEYGDLVSKNASGIPVDPWGNTLSAEVVKEGDWLLVEISSPGPDGSFRSADDVSHRERIRKVSGNPRER